MISNNRSTWHFAGFLGERRLHSQPCGRVTPGWFSAVKSWGVLSPHLPHSLQLPAPPSPVLSSANSSTRSMFLRELKTLWEFMVECKISKPPGSYLPPPAVLRFWVLVGINVAVMSVYLCPCSF